MKNYKFAKIAVAILTLALVLGAAFAMTVSAETSAPKIISQNIEYGADYRIMYAVDAEGITGPVTLRVYSDEAMTNLVDEKIATTTEDITAGGVTKTVYTFTTQAISHLGMTDVFYVTASTEANGTSAPKRYSVAEYLYQRLSDATASDAQITLYNRTIAYGESLQLVVGQLDATEDADKLISNLRYVTAADGIKLTDGYSAGVYPVGTQLNPKGVGPWKFYTYTEKGAQLGTTGYNLDLVVPETEGAVHMHITNLLTEDFEDYTDITANSSNLIYHSNAKTTSGLIKDGDHGNVINIEDWQSGGITLRRTATMSRGNATAFVVSFDMKVDVSNVTEASSATGPRAKFQWYLYDSAGAVIGRFQLHPYQAGATTQIGLGSNDAWSEETQRLPVETTEWFNVRLVMYDGDSHIYMYVNGDMTSRVLHNNTKYDTMTNSGYDVSIIERVRFEFADSTGLGLSIDNFFAGFTYDVKPQ